MILRFAHLKVFGAVVAALLAASAVGGAPAVAGDAYLTRIEPRPYYGATVTLEAGVRVFRTLPSTKHMVINPGHGTKLNLSHTEINSRSVSHNHYDDHNGRHSGPSRAGLAPFFLQGRGRVRERRAGGPRLIRRGGGFRRTGGSIGRVRIH